MRTPHNNRFKYIDLAKPKSGALGLFILTVCRISENKSPWRVLPYMAYIGMCRCEEYGFQAVYSSIGYINQSVWV